MTPIVSVLMTAYNREKYIGEAIESVLASTYQDWELIVVDDRSTDNTLAIARSYESKDNRIKVYINEQNLGDYPNRNRAASFARGKYLKYVDSDDKIYPHGLEQLVSYMEKFPHAGYGLCTIAQDNERIFPFELTPYEAYRRHYFGNRIFLRAPLSSIMRTTVFRKEGGFKNERMAGDFEMWHRLSLKYSVVLMPQGIIWYRLHSAQEMSDHSKYLTSYIHISERMITSDECPLNSSEKKTVLDRLRNYKLRLLFRAARKLNVKKLLEISRML